MTLIPCIIRDAKREWLMAQLNRMGIRYGIHPKTSQIGVPLDDMKAVMDMLYTPINGPNKLPPVRIVDVDNNNGMFDQQYWNIIAEIIETEKLPERDEWHLLVTSSMVEIPYQGQIAQIEMYDTDSGNLSAIGFVPYEKNGAIDKFAIFVRFKGAVVIYAYYPVDRTTTLGLVQEINRKHRNEKDASVGHYFHINIRSLADAGQIRCNKLNFQSGTWERVVAKNK